MSKEEWLYRCEQQYLKNGYLNTVKNKLWAESLFNRLDYDVSKSPEDSADLDLDWDK